MMFCCDGGLLEKNEWMILAGRESGTIMIKRARADMFSAPK